MGWVQGTNVVWTLIRDDPPLMMVSIEAPVDADVRVRLLLDKPHAKKRLKAMAMNMAGDRHDSAMLIAFEYDKGIAVFDEFKAATELLMDKIAVVVNRENLKNAMAKRPTPTMEKS